ncbi:DoxX family membrane protein [Puniceicoccales bacterium CK1056]|uniref:DoxX family membrane protein n=1 Tax=Oceanipulchritudo coccoides TaxID=2706888 RepID=A0A6B2LWT4_9BACT|nr:DoxX family membrane protein [Oceanipulchritudo coccoides]NDV60881.1 DoxX family membrane protein [Oceanipulchritudo coccoides]
MKSTIQGIKSMFRHPDLGLMIIRAALGIILMLAGWNKFMAGEAQLQWVGSNMKYIGMDVGTDTLAALFYGVLAAGTELLGGLLLIAGWLFRTATVPLMGTMFIATLFKYQTTAGDLTQFGYPMIFFFVLLGLLLIGPGKFSLQRD